MGRHVMWVPWVDPGLEHLHVDFRSDGVFADGIILGIRDGIPFRARYQIECDHRWTLRTVEIRGLDRADKAIGLKADARGRWFTSSGDPLSSLQGCLDVDISATPFTNSLPIRRLGLKVGESADLTVAYIRAPEMELRPVHQRYTCLEATGRGGLYKYEGLFRNFTADLAVDEDGLVIDYPQTFRWLWPTVR